MNLTTELATEKANGKHKDDIIVQKDLKIDELEKKLAQMQKDWEKEVKDLKESHEKAMQAARDQHDKDKQELRDLLTGQHQTHVDGLHKQHG